MSRFLVTGGAGFIGSHITHRLVEHGHFVRVLDNFSSGKTENLKVILNKVEVINGDICSAETCLKACAGMDYVLHQAALRSVPKSMKEPAEYNSVNIGGLLNMLEAAQVNRIRRFVFASSSSVYGDTDRFPEKEGFLPQPVSPYALTKLAGEHYCRIFNVYRGLETVSLRYFNVFGPRQSLDDEYAVVVPKFIHCIMRGENPPIYGNGRQSRDFTFVDNVVEANILAAEKPCTGKVFNIASGRDRTVLELASNLNRIMGKDIKPVFLDKRPGDVFKTLADISQAGKFLGFRPRVDFLEGLKRTVEYFKSNG
jgi:nucleoside-diphosphate-sugar epimerase